MQICAFDLRYPISDQIRQVESILGRLRHHFEIKTVSRPKLHTGDFAQLLRVFDASWNGAADDYQVREIYSSDQRKATTPTEIHDEQLRWSTAGLESIRRKRKDAVRYVLEDSRNHLSMVAMSWSGSTGFGMWSFMPASRQSWRS